MAFLLFAHRGANRLAPENTLAAFHLALEAGCDGCECDVQLSRDGVLTVFHDETLTRLVGLAHAVPELTHSQLAALRLSGTGHAAPADTGIPTLEQVWQLHRQRQKILLVELKYFSEAHTPRERLFEAVRAFVETQSVTDDFCAISFDELLLEWLKAKYPLLRTGYIFSDPARFARHQADCIAWADVLLPRADGVNAPLVAWATQQRRPLYAWVADDETSMTRLAAAGVGGLLSNEPARLTAWATHRPAAP